MRYWSLPLFLPPKDQWENGKKDILYNLIDKNYLKKETVIESIYGAPPFSIWDGARMLGDRIYSLNEINSIVKEMNSLGIGVYSTFSNLYLKEEHLGDYYSNKVLEILSRNSLNAIKIGSPLLENYIKKKFPEIKIYPSVIKLYYEYYIKNISFEKTIVDFQNRYKRIVTSSVFYLNEYKEVLDNLDRKKTILLVNDPCVPFCINAKLHSEATSKKKFEFEPFLDKEWTTGEKCISEKGYDPIKLNLEDIDRYYSNGFIFFKLAGRPSFTKDVLSDIIYYLIKDKYKDKFMENIKIQEKF